MSVLAIDIETYSSVDLTKAGVYAYTDSPDFEILLFAFAFDEEKTQIVDIACGEKLPERVLNAIHDPAVVKTAFNAQFERTCIGRYLGERLSPEGWQCTAVQSGAYEITGLSNPNSPVQMKEWLASQGIQAESLDKKAVKELKKDVDGDVLEMLKLRQLMAKTSVKKYEAIERSVCSDGRVHGLLQFYGANRTGRWAGRLVQVQNLPQNHIPDLELARSLVRDTRFDDIDPLYGFTPTVLSELIRTAFVPKPGCRFIVSDFAAIEARTLAWFAGEQWRLDSFEAGKDIYCESAAHMFGVPVEKHGVNSHLRQRGKIAELALAMLRLRNAGFEIVMHIHDEAVLEVPEGVSNVDEICRIMAIAPDWAAGLPLRADGYECRFYKKD